VAVRTTVASPTHTYWPSPATLLASATAKSFLPAKNFIFLQDTHNNLRFLVDSGASLSILPHAAPNGSHLVEANGKTIPAWGFHRFSFSRQNFEFNFLLAAVATPFLGIDFFDTFWSLYSAWGLWPFFLQGKYFFVTDATLTPNQDYY
jgi:hypothetical protein